MFFAWFIVSSKTHQKAWHRPGGPGSFNEFHKNKTPKKPKNP